MNRPDPMRRVPSPAAADRQEPIEFAAPPNAANLPAIKPPPARVDGHVEVPSPPATHYPPKIAKAIIAITRDLGHIEKAGKNSFQNYNYPKWEDIVDQLAPLLAKNGLIITQTELERGLFAGDRLVAMTYLFTIVHEDGDVWPDRPKWTATCRVVDNKGQADDKAVQKSHTTAHKYFCLQFFKIRVGDAEETDRERSKPPVPSPTGKVRPYTVSRDRETTASWAAKFIALVNKAEPDEIGQWDELNKESLEIVFAKDQPTYAKIDKAFQQRMAEASPEPQKPAAGASVRPTVATAPPAAETHQRTNMASSAIPDAGTQPEEFLKWADGQLASVTDPHGLEQFYNTLIEPQSEGLFPPDKEELLALFQKHERRLAP